MRLDRILLCAAVTALLAGCVTTAGTNSQNDKMPTTTKAQDDESAAAVHTDLAQHYIQLGNLQGAMEKLQIALKFDPKYVRAHTVIAYVYQRIGDNANAEAHYREAVELDPSKGDLNNNFGQFLCSEGKAQEALPYFAKALTDPFYNTPDVALTNQGVCQMRLNDPAGAANSFRLATDKNPANAVALLELANALYLNNDAFHASAYLQRFEALGQTSPDSLKLGYEIESRLGHTDNAQNYSKRLLSQFPDSEQARALNEPARP